MIVTERLDALELARLQRPTLTSSRTGAYVGASIMVLTQIAMAAIMTMTPVHMRALLLVPALAWGRRATTTSAQAAPQH